MGGFAKSDHNIMTKKCSSVYEILAYLDTNIGD